MNRVSQLWNRFRVNKDAKTLAGNFMWLSLLQVAGYVFPLITLPYLARVIGVDGFGKIAFAMAVMVWIQTIADWGFNFTATRDVAQNRDNPQRVAQIFSDVLWARCLLMFVSFAVLLLLICFIPTFREHWAVLLVSFLMIPGHILFPDWFFQAIERMKYITILNLLMKVVFTVAVFVFISEEQDYLLQPLFTSLGYGVSGIIALYVILGKWHYRLQRPNFNQIVDAIKASTDVFVNNIFPNLYNSLSIVLLGFWGGPVANGLLDAGSKFVNIGQQLMQVVSRVFYPFLSRRIDKHQIFVRLNMILAVIGAVSLFVLAPLLIKWFFTPEFEQAIPVMRLMSLSIIFLALSNVYGTNYLIVVGQERPLRNMTAIASVIGFVMAIPLIYYWTYFGAALVITLTRGLLGVMVMIKAKQIKHAQHAALTI